MVSVLVSKAVDRGFIGGVMIIVLVSKAVDCGFIGGLMISVVVSKAEVFGLTQPGLEPTIYHF
jgi:uncharacterized membrane protein YqhA